MKTLLLATSLIFAGAATPLSAQSPAYAGDPVRAVASKPAKQLSEDRLCLPETGTRIKRPAERCSDRPGRSYSREDLRSTGEVDLDAALQRLDPSITRRRR